jgi:hypothetical protein
MEFNPSRLRKGEWIVGAGGIVLLASMFLLKWYGLTGTVAPQAEHLGFPTALNGWHGLTTLRWFMLVTIIVSLALAYFQAARRSPAVPVSLSVIVFAVALITLIALIYRVLINEPGPDSLIDQKAGAYIGLIATLAIVSGGYLSMREEGVRAADGPGEIETIRLTGVTGVTGSSS